LRQHLTKLGLGKIEPLAWHWVRDWVRYWLRYWRNHHRLGSWHVAALQAQPIYFATYRAVAVVKTVADLSGAQSSGPQFCKKCDVLIIPVHRLLQTAIVTINTTHTIAP
jgi:hypothetical protein